MQTYLTETKDRTRVGANIHADDVLDAELQCPANLMVVGRLWKRVTG